MEPLTIAGIATIVLTGALAKIEESNLLDATSKLAAKVKETAEELWEENK